MDAASSSSPHSLQFNTDDNGSNKKKKAMTKRAAKDKDTATSVSSISLRGTHKRRNPKLVIVKATRRNPNFENIGFHLGMSMAVFSNQILMSNGGEMSSDHLTKVCASAVRESLAKDFGNTLDNFIHNFEQSFGSTLRTLNSLKQSYEDSTELGGFSPRDESCSCTSTEEYHYHSKELVNYNMEDAQTNNLTTSSAFEKSVIEQTRANDLKSWELCLTMKKLALKEEEVALGYDSNYLQRSKIAMGLSKASFRALKFKTELEDMRHSELLRKCNDCLVAGLLVIAASMSYGTYVYSYRRITEATAVTCTPSKDYSESWWNPMAPFVSAFQVLMCQAALMSRMFFGSFMILAIAYLILQRSAGSVRVMPVTFIVLLLGIFCGWAGKFCVDTLGGSGYYWLLHWEVLCMVHFFCNVCIPVAFRILHGPVLVTPGAKGIRSSVIPYWLRRSVFYGVAGLFIPLSCGLLPFASLGEWKSHFLLLLTDVDY